MLYMVPLEEDANRRVMADLRVDSSQRVMSVDFVEWELDRAMGRDVWRIVQNTTRRITLGRGAWLKLHAAIAGAEAGREFMTQYEVRS